MVRYNKNSQISSHRKQREFLLRNETLKGRKLARNLYAISWQDILGLIS